MHIIFSYGFLGLNFYASKTTKSIKILVLKSLGYAVYPYQIANALCFLTWESCNV